MNTQPTAPGPAAGYGAHVRAWDWRRALSPTGNLGDAVFRLSLFCCALLFTAFGSRFFNVYLDQPIASLTVQIFNYAVSPYDEWHAQAWAATLVLMTLILVINVSVRVLTRKKF